MNCVQEQLIRAEISQVYKLIEACSVKIRYKTKWGWGQRRGGGGGGLRLLGALMA